MRLRNLTYLLVGLFLVGACETIGEIGVSEETTELKAKTYGGQLKGGGSLPPCVGSYDKTTWTDCFGTETFADGRNYVGEYKEGKFHGQGTYTYGPKSKWAGDKYVGEWKDNKHHGQGIYHPYRPKK